MCDKKEIIKRNFEITRIDIQMTNIERGNSQALVDIYINDLIKINDICVFESSGTKQINMPYKYDGLFYSFFVNIIDEDIDRLVHDEIIKKFDEQCAKFKNKKNYD